MTNLLKRIFQNENSTDGINFSITNTDLNTIASASWEQCENWYSMLNTWKWPDELLPAIDPEAEKTIRGKFTRRSKLMQVIEKKVGLKYLLRMHNIRLGNSESEFEDFWRGNFEGDEAAKARHWKKLCAMVEQQKK
jgi:hypothetical protein